MKAFLETWRDIAGYEGLYEVSDLGNVRSLNYLRTGQTRILKPMKTPKGYQQVHLCKDGNIKKNYVHRLVAQAFIENPNNLPEINHKDENKENNAVTNLEWCDHKYNINHGTCIERVAKANTNNPKCSEKIIQMTLDYVFVKEWPSTAECGRNGFSAGNVSLCCNNKYGLQGNVYKGFRWVKAEDYYKEAVA